MGLLLCLLFSSVLACNREKGSEIPEDALFESVEDTQSVDTFSPVPITCDEVVGTRMKLHEKARRFDELAETLHIRAGQNLLWSVFMTEDLASFERVDMSDNVGSWTAIYSASQAFRYAVTKDNKALLNLKRVMKGQLDMMRITGVRGLFTRVIVDPSLEGFPSAQQLDSWYPDCDLSKRHCKRFVEVKEGEYKGKWFKTDVSKDEYPAHMFSMAVAWELVDDAEVRGMVQEIVCAVGDHLITNGLRIRDIDGEVTTYGKVFATALDDFPGFNAALALSWMKLAGVVCKEKYEDFYRKCLLQLDVEDPCIEGEAPRSYLEYLPLAGLDLDCKTNWNNHNMLELAYYSLIRMEQDPVLRQIYWDAYKRYVWDADDPRPMRIQKNTLFTFFYLANMPEGEEFPKEEAREAICTMKRFPEEKSHHAVDTLSKYKTVCTDRSGEPMASVQDFIPIDEDSMDNYYWNRNPWKLKKEEENRRIVEFPEDYLVAYWMGRYFGFISEEM